MQVKLIYTYDSLWVGAEFVTAKACDYDFNAGVRINYIIEEGVCINHRADKLILNVKCVFYFSLLYYHNYLVSRNGSLNFKTVTMCYVFINLILQRILVTTIERNLNNILTLFSLTIFRVIEIVSFSY